MLPETYKGQVISTISVETLVAVNTFIMQRVLYRKLIFNRRRN